MAWTGSGVLRWCVCVCVCLLDPARAANILAVTPAVSKSHFVVFDVLIKELLGRGHNLTVITTFPEINPIENLTEINVRPFRAVMVNNLSVEKAATTFHKSFFLIAPLFLNYIEETEQVLTSPVIADFISSNSTFDLIISEMFVDDVFLGFAHRFNAPMITFSSCYMFPWTTDSFGIPANPAYVPGFYSGYSGYMNFFQRLHNTVLDICGSLYYIYFLEPKSTSILRKTFGNSAPSVNQLMKNVSLNFLNTHFSIFAAEPLPPQIVDISGIHVKPAKEINQDLDRWMNESSHGVIYFSFGSMLRGATLPSDKVNAFLQAFDALPQRVLWKWEEDPADRLPANVKVMKWLPQRDVLAHPNVRVFISHGGLLGTTEAVVSGVPILGIPMYGDQPNNVAALVDKGVAVHVDYNNISEASLSYALKTLLHDKSYSENARLLSRRFLDRPMSPLDTAVYWTEYVIRHGGAPHLQSAAVRLSWYQYYLLDVVAALLAVLAVFLYLAYYVFRCCSSLLCPASSKLKTS